jgi:glycosyltransferase involved in cell wall biosynthesis
MILRTFASALRRYPHCRLLLKGLDGLYSSQQLLADAIRHTLGEQRERAVSPRGLCTSADRCRSTEWCRSITRAIAILSPYLAEGFNMPALEAAACGLPLICTAGGPTDDFVTDAFAHRIRSQVSILPQPTSGLGAEAFALLPDEPHLQQLAHAIYRRSRVSNAGIERGAGPRGRAHSHEARRRQAADSAAAAVKGPI